MTTQGRPAPSRAERCRPAARAAGRSLTVALLAGTLYGAVCGSVVPLLGNLAGAVLGAGLGAVGGGVAAVAVGLTGLLGPRPALPWSYCALVVPAASAGVLGSSVMQDVLGHTGAALLLACVPPGCAVAVSWSCAAWCLAPVRAPVDLGRVRRRAVAVAVVAPVAVLAAVAVGVLVAGHQPR